MEIFNDWKGLQVYIKLLAHLFDYLISDASTVLKMEDFDLIVDFEQNLETLLSECFLAFMFVAS